MLRGLICERESCVTFIFTERDCEREREWERQRERESWERGYVRVFLVLRVYVSFLPSFRIPFVRPTSICRPCPHALTVLRDIGRFIFSSRHWTCFTVVVEVEWARDGARALRPTLVRYFTLLFMSIVCSCSIVVRTTTTGQIISLWDVRVERSRFISIYNCLFCLSIGYSECQLASIVVFVSLFEYGSTSRSCEREIETERVNTRPFLCHSFQDVSAWLMLNGTCACLLIWLKERSAAILLSWISRIDWVIPKQRLDMGSEGCLWDLVF